MFKLKNIILIFVILLVAAFFYVGGQQYFTLQYAQAQLSFFQQTFAEQPFTVILIYMVGYILVTALSLPGAAILTLLGGAIFGLVQGTIIVSFASTIGATLAFLASRLVLKDWVQRKFGAQLKTINSGFEKEGPFYLFTLRLIPAVPFFVINLVMGLLPISAWKFYLVSQIGMLAGTVVYVNAGTALAQLESLSGILSPQMIISFTILGLFPLLAKKVISYFQARKYLGRYIKPKTFDYNMVVIGGGSAGLVSAYIAAAAQAEVALIEKHKMGGDCLNTGCVPSKALIRSAKFLADVKKSKDLGIKKVDIDYDFSDVMERVQRVVKKIEPHDSMERYRSLGVDCYQGEAKIISPYQVEVNGKVLTTKNIIIASGAGPFVPRIPGLDQMNCLTSDNLWSIRTLPKNLLVLGGGPIGCELAQAFQRLGSSVTQLEKASRILIREDIEIAKLVADKMMEDGVNILVHHEAVEFKLKDGKKFCVVKQGDQLKEIQFDEVLVALGRKANTQGFGLEDLEIKTTPQGTIQVDDFLATNYPNIYVCGDAAGPYQFTHTASHQAWFCAVNAMIRPFYSFKVDYRVIPWATYTAPEVGRVGLNEIDAKEKNIPYEVTTYDMKGQDRALTEESAYGIVKVLTVPGKDKILGATIVGLHAGDILAEYVLAMKYNIGLNKILGTIHVYPTLAEANKAVAGQWKKNHVTKATLDFARKFNNWRRG